MIAWDLILAATALFFLLLFAFLNGRPNRRSKREIAAFSELRRTIDLSVEDGSRMQVSLGAGGLLGAQSAAALVGLSLLRQVAETASDSDQPPIASSGDAALSLVAQDTLRAAYRRLGIRDQYDNSLGTVTGLTPFSYGAGTMPMILDNVVSGSALVGSFGLEAGLITAASQPQQRFTLGGSDSLAAQAVLFASAQQPLIGEELYATGAYADAGRMHDASLHAQDVLRWLLILGLIGNALANLFGMGL